MTTTTTTTAPARPAITSMGRDALIARVRELEARVETSEKRATDLHDNLTAVQTRCTALLSANRLEKHFEEKPADASALLSLVWAMDKARAKHPHGCSFFAVAEEAGEVARAMARETAERAHDELLDVAVVAMRLYLGEVDDQLAPRVPFARSER